MMKNSAVILLLAVVICSSCQQSKEEGNTRVIPAFELTNQDGREFHSDALKDKVWVADFFFTSCPMICPKMSEAMATIQDSFASHRDFRLVSFSIDPKRDKPAVLKAYAEKYGANLSQWSFLTGDRSKIEELSRKAFLLAVDHKDGEPENITHSSRLVLINRKGEPLRYVESVKDGAVDWPAIHELMHHIKQELDQ